MGGEGALLRPCMHTRHSGSPATCAPLTWQASIGCNFTARVCITRHNPLCPCLCTAVRPFAVSDPSPNLQESLTNFGINSAALAILSFLVYRDLQAQKKATSVTSREEELGRLLVRGCSNQSQQVKLCKSNWHTSRCEQAELQVPWRRLSDTLPMTPQLLQLFRGTQQHVPLAPVIFCLCIMQ